MNEYIVIWKDSPGQQVSTVVDAHNQPVMRDSDYVVTNKIAMLLSETDILRALEKASGTKYAITRDDARNTLGWDL